MDTSRASVRAGIPSAWRPLGLLSPEQVGSEPPRIAHEDQHAGEITAASDVVEEGIALKKRIGGEAPVRRRAEPAGSRAGLVEQGVGQGDVIRGVSEVDA